MPVYEYICQQCNFEFELLIFADEIAVCPQCGSKNLQKKVSLCSTHLKNDSGDTISTSKCSSCVSKKCNSCK